MYTVWVYCTSVLYTVSVFVLYYRYTVLIYYRSVILYCTSVISIVLSGVLHIWPLSLIKDFSLIKATFEPMPKTHFAQGLVKNRDTIGFLIVSEGLAHYGRL